MASLPASSQVLAAYPNPPNAAEEPAIAERRSYGQILKSSAMLGGSQAVNIAIGILRTKAMAVILGPSGVGLAGLYGSIADLAVTFAGMGVGSSGVRQIAEAVGSGDTLRIARTAAVLRRTSFILGVGGAGLLLAFARPVSVLTFGTAERTAAVCLLAFAVLLRLVSSGQGALIHGMRRISDLAKMNVWSALLGTVATIPLVYVFKEDGVAPSLVVVSAVTILTSWWYSRRIDVAQPSVPFNQLTQEVAPLLKLGFAFMASGLMMMGSAYLIRIAVLRVAGFEATGYYQAAWTIGGLYVNFILQAMGADFYPRLTAVSHNNILCNRLVNEQTRIGLLMAGPGAIATLTFAPLIISWSYTPQFNAAIEILRWICLGAAIRVLTWPMGFIILAKGRPGLFFWSDFAYSTVHLAMAWFWIRALGVNGAGIAFFGSYIVHAVIIYPIAARLSGFRWSSENKRTGIFFAMAIVAVFGGFYMLSPVLAACLGGLVAIASGIYAIRTLIQITAFGWVTGVLGRLPAFGGFTGPR
jgi:enterobacterial common antigen flippase